MSFNFVYENVTLLNIMFFLFVTLCFTPLLYSLAPVSKYLVNLHYTITKKKKKKNLVGLILVMNAINHGFNSKGDTFNLGLDRGVKRYYYFCGKENLISWTSQIYIIFYGWLYWGMTWIFQAWEQSIKLSALSQCIFGLLYVFFYAHIAKF